MELVYDHSGMVATKGQALAHESCGNGAFCHSSAAKGGSRFGAPAGMNFDMLPSPSGWPELVQRRENAWDLVQSGDMPPGKTGQGVVDEGGWVFDVHLSADAPKLPPLSSDAGKAALRNWLACGAPIVAATKVPSWAQAPATGSGKDGGTASGFDAIFTSILQPSCAIAGCHNASAAAGGLKLGDACASYAELLKAGACGMPRVRPGDGASLLLNKLESRTPVCGGGMPPKGSLAADKIASVRAWVEAGAEAPSCK